MLTLRKISPSLPLLPYIRHYEYREILSEDQTAIRPLPARSDQMLQFHLLGQFEVFDYRAGKSLLVPQAVVVGPQTWRAYDLLLKARSVVFVIVFQPTGFHRLFGLPMTELTDSAFEASEVIGKDVKRLHNRLRESAKAGEMVQLTERFLLQISAQPFHAVQEAAARILKDRGQGRLDFLIQATGLGERQFERKFITQVGMPPKLYSRIARLNYALELKVTRPDLSWAGVACDADYFDQTHLIKDFKALAGDTPSEFLRAFSGAPDLILPSSPDAILQPATVSYYRCASD